MIDWDACLSEVPYFHWSGIAAAVSTGRADTCARRWPPAHRKGMIISSDFNYRTSLWKYGKRPADVMPGLLQYSKVAAVADLDSAACIWIETDGNAVSKKGSSMQPGLAGTAAPAGGAAHELPGERKGSAISIREHCCIKGIAFFHRLMSCPS